MTPLPPTPTPEWQETPRTDEALWATPVNWSHSKHFVDAEFARQLESELSALTTQNSELAQRLEDKDSRILELGDMLAHELQMNESMRKRLQEGREELVQIQGYLKMSQASDIAHADGWVAADNQIATLRTQLAAAVADSSRVAWLDKNAEILPEGCRIWFDYSGDFRAAIDTTMSA